MTPVTKDAERVRKPRLPKKRVLQKSRRKSKRAHNGGKKTEPEQLERPERGILGRGVVFCPKCGSNSIFWASGLPHLWSIWECRNCGYRGAFIARDGKLAEKLREDYAKRTR